MASETRSRSATRASGGREVICRLRRGYHSHLPWCGRRRDDGGDLRRGIGSQQLQLLRGDWHAGFGRLDRRPHAHLRVSGGRARDHRPRQSEVGHHQSLPLRAECQSDVRGDGRALRCGGNTGTAGEAARQSQGGSGCAVGRALDPGRPAKEKILPFGRSQPSHSGTTGAPQQPAFPQTRRVPPPPLRVTRQAGIARLARRTLRVLATGKPTASTSTITWSSTTTGTACPISSHNRRWKCAPPPRRSRSSIAAYAWPVTRAAMWRTLPPRSTITGPRRTSGTWSGRPPAWWTGPRPSARRPANCLIASWPASPTRNKAIAPASAFCGFPSSIRTSEWRRLRAAPSRQVLVLTTASNRFCSAIWTARRSRRRPSQSRRSTTPTFAARNTSTPVHSAAFQAVYEPPSGGGGAPRHRARCWFLPQHQIDSAVPSGQPGDRAGGRAKAAAIAWLSRWH